MTISSTTRKAGPFVGNGVTTEFPFDFKLFSTSDLRVVRADALGVEMDLAHVTDCTVTLNADQDENPGGTVTLNAPLADGFRLVLLSAVPELQPVDLTNQGGFYPELVNGGLDRATVQVQQLREQMIRSITVPVTSEQFDLALPNPSPGQLIGWTGVGLTNFDPSELVSVVAYGDAKLDVFEGDGTTATFALSASPGSQNNLRIAIAGVVQTPGVDFSWSGGTALTFTAAPPAGTSIVVQYQEALQDIGGATEAGREAAEAVLVTKTEKAPTLATLASVASAEGIVVTPVGEFVWTTGDQSANVTADPQKGVWVAPASAPSGSAGAWRRVFNGPIDPVWFGGRTSAAINAALAFAKFAGNTPVVGTGLFVCTETIGYAGGSGEAPYLDLSAATLWRQGDYGPTVYFRCLPDGTPLERGFVKIGRAVDVNNAMTVAVSKAHLVLDNVNFVTWSLEEIIGGCGGVRLLGCASDVQEGRISWRFGSVYRGAGSAGYYKGPSLIAPAIYGGDSGINGTVDIYAGDLLRRTGSTSGSSTTVTINTSGVQVGDIVTGEGTIGDPYALIPQGTTVAAAAGTTITLSTAVALPASTPLIFYRPALDEGFQITSCDGLWGEGFVHVIGAKENSFRFGSDREFYNVRLKFMADFGPGNAILFEGSAPIAHSAFYSHNQYGPTVGASILHPTTVLDNDGLRSNRGRQYGGTVAFPESHLKNSAGVTKFSQVVGSSGELVTKYHDAAGAVVGDVYQVVPGGRFVYNFFDIIFTGRSVADLTLEPMIYAPPGTVAWCSDLRRLQLGGTLEAAPGGGGTVNKCIDGNWYIAGTNIPAQA